MSSSSSRPVAGGSKPPPSGHRLFVASATAMPDIADASVQLVVTSPPYPMIELWDSCFAEQGARDYDAMHALLARVWAECTRVLVDGGLLAIDVGDATRTVDGLFRVFPNHARVIEECHRLGLVTLPYILWKKPTNRPNAFLGSGFLPPNGYVTMDCEYILLFRKGAPRRFPPRDPTRRASGFTKEQRDTWFSQIWEIRGVRQDSDGLSRRTAAFPAEVPRRLVRMFSVEGETVLDPFAGTGTTLRTCAELGRTFIGYERDEHLVATLREGTLDIPLMIERPQRR